MMRSGSEGLVCAQEVLKAVTVCARGLDNIFMYNGAEGVYGPTVERERERDLDSAACQEARMTGQVWGAGAKEQGVTRDVDTRARRLREDLEGSPRCCCPR